MRNQCQTADPLMTWVTKQYNNISVSEKHVATSRRMALCTVNLDLSGQLGSGETSAEDECMRHPKYLLRVHHLQKLQEGCPWRFLKAGSWRTDSTAHIWARTVSFCQTSSSVVFDSLHRKEQCRKKEGTIKSAKENSG